MPTLASAYVSSCLHYAGMLTILVKTLSTPVTIF